MRETCTTTWSPFKRWSILFPRCVRNKGLLFRFSWILILRNRFTAEEAWQSAHLNNFRQWKHTCKCHLQRYGSNEHSRFKSLSKLVCAIFSQSLSRALHNPNRYVAESGKNTATVVIIFFFCSFPVNGNAAYFSALKPLLLEQPWPTNFRLFQCVHRGYKTTLLQQRVYCTHPLRTSFSQ